jgi:hypothetical protein
MYVRVYVRARARVYIFTCFRLNCRTHEPWGRIFCYFPILSSITINKNKAHHGKVTYFTYLLTHSLTPWCKTLFEKLTVTQLVKNIDITEKLLHKSSRTQQEHRKANKKTENFKEHAYLKVNSYGPKKSSWNVLIWFITHSSYSYITTPLVIFMFLFQMTSNNVCQEINISPWNKTQRCKKSTAQAQDVFPILKRTERSEKESYL